MDCSADPCFISYCYKTLSFSIIAFIISFAGITDTLVWEDINISSETLPVGARKLIHFHMVTRLYLWQRCQCSSVLDLMNDWGYFRTHTHTQYLNVMILHVDQKWGNLTSNTSTSQKDESGVFVAVWLCAVKHQMWGVWGEGWWTLLPSLNSK